MRGTNDSSYNRAASSRSNTAYLNIFDQNPHHDNDGIPPYSLKILGPLAPILLSDDYSDPEKLQNNLRIYTVSVLGTSAFFWLWAFYNTFHLRNSSGGFDLGLVSFFGSGISSVLLLRSALGGKCHDRNQRFGCCGEKEVNENNVEVDVYGIRKLNRRRDDATPIHAPPGTSLRAFVAMTQATVVANYLLGILFALTAGTRVYVYFATYCFIFSLLWLMVAYAGWVLISVYREAVGRTYGEEVLNGPRQRTGLCRGCLIALTNRSAYSETVDDNYYDEEDDIDDELRALYEGRGGYTNA
mmetsp:Transcript_3041/g.6669  ORF Transcript_3041/g.6669 Transcript_3041/m.6669 type:complete len:299 (+) Transcript_3041:96-992(+)|eukprot:CAMPEP_0172316340 /NCGR_PEP_ID=MMETSP1058-20130122/27850_1 /TAXON_ID=83371 /ORGANISM="Detonula confervacea, Strain CCMP 353" /LENGTH=298 /DNA_ID=CAMNT_0013030623 /DNA_START=17 /DNA_END=913 /DNA_ORIENTATION=+